jgi:hypothetical protein
MMRVERQRPRIVGIGIDGVTEAMDDERKGEGRLKATRETVA